MKALMGGLLALVLLAGGCKGQGQGEEGAPEAHGGHGAAESDPRPSLAFTVWTPQAELFAEHRAFVVGEGSKFAAHLTRLADGSPLREGKVAVVATGPDGQEHRFGVEAPARPGIFQPVVRLAQGGRHRLRFEVDAPGVKERIEAGEVVVFADAKAAQEAIGEEAESPLEIPFLKEQQWRIPFASQAVVARRMAQGLELLGEVKAAAGREVAIAAPVAGRLSATATWPRPGQRVRQGQILAGLSPDAPPGEATASLRAAWLQAQATQAQAQADLARAERLVAAEAAPAKRLEEARLVAAVAAAQRMAAEAALKRRQRGLAGQGLPGEELLRLRAPISGTVVSVQAVPGAHVAQGAFLIRLVDLRRVWVEGRVPEAEANRVAAAQRAHFTVAGAEGEGRLVAVGQVLDPSTRSAPATYEADNPLGLFRLGMSARITAHLGEELGAVVPTSAIVDDHGKPTAYVQLGGESFEARDLVLGPQRGGEVLVRSGLKPGERVVVRGGYEIRLSTLSEAVPAHGHEH